MLGDLLGHWLGHLLLHLLGHLPLLALMLTSILVYSAWSIALFCYYLGPLDMRGLGLCWPTFTIPLIVAHQLIEIVLLKCCKRYHNKIGRGFHATWTLHGVAVLITTCLSVAGVFETYAEDPGVLIGISLLCNGITLYVNFRIFRLYKDFTLADSTDDEALLQA